MQYLGVYQSRGQAASHYPDYLTFYTAIRPLVAFWHNQILHSTGDSAKEGNIEKRLENIQAENRKLSDDI